MSIAGRLGILSLALIGCRENTSSPTSPTAQASTLRRPPIAGPRSTSAIDVPGLDVDVPLVPPSPALFVRDQFSLRGLRTWDGALVAMGDRRGGGPYQIDLADRLERARVVPLDLPHTERVLDVATLGETPVALVRTRGALALMFHRGNSWSIEPVPEPARARNDVILAAGQDALVLLQPGQLHVLRAGSWKSMSIESAPGRGSSHVLVTRDRVLMGFDAGEWGGALVSLDLATGASTPYPVTDPVTDLVAGPDGTPWAVMGLAHMGLVKGTLSRLDASAWTVVAKVDGFEGHGGKHEVNERVGWSLPLASFDAAAFDEQGRLHVLTGELGVVRRDGEHWTQLTPGWPDFVYVRGLAVRGALLVIATFDAGVVLWDTSTGKARRLEVNR
jgi:hypothetical protein